MKKAIVYYAVMMFLGILCNYIFNYNFNNGIVLSLLICSGMIVTIRDKYVVPILCFFCIGFLLSYQYFCIDIPESGIYDISIKSIDNNYIKCNYKSRDIIIYGDDKLKNLYSGTDLKVQGEFIEDIDYKYGSLGRLYVKNIINKEEGIVAKINKFKDITIKNIYDSIGKEIGSVVVSAAYGYKDDISEEQKDSLEDLGIMHIISVSGFHVGLVFALIDFVFGCKVGIAVTLLYTIFTGFRASTLRAFIMITVMKISKKLYKKYNPLSALAFSSIILLVYRPCFAVDMGFHLSYLAVLGIIFFYSKIQKKLFKLPKKTNESFSLCLSAQVFVTPYMIFAYNSFAPAFIIGNFILVPIYSFIVILGVIFIPMQFLYVLGEPILYAMKNITKISIYIASFLQDIVPKKMYIDYEYGIIYIVFFIGICMYMSKIKNGKHIAISAILSAIIITITPIPRISLIEDSKSKIITIKDGLHRDIILLNTMHYKDVEEKYRGFCKVDTKHKDALVNLRNKYGILIIKDKSYIITKNQQRLIKPSYECIYTVIDGEIVEIGG